MFAMSRSWPTNSVAGTVTGCGGDSHKDEYDSEVLCRSTGSRVRCNKGDCDRRRTSVCDCEQRGHFHCGHFSWRYALASSRLCRSLAVVKKRSMMAGLICYTCLDVITCILHADVLWLPFLRCLNYSRFFVSLFFRGNHRLCHIPERFYRKPIVIYEAGCCYYLNCAVNLFMEFCGCF